jgi:hypothetical protein
MGILRTIWFNSIAFSQIFGFNLRQIVVKLDFYLVEK